MQRLVRAPLGDQGADLVVDPQQLVHADPAQVAGVVALRAAGAVHPLADLGAQHPLDHRRLGGVGGDRLLAGVADAAQQALAHDAVDGGGDEEWLHAHVDKAVQGRHRIDRVQR